MKNTKNPEAFVKRENIELLWDVLLDELCIDVNNKQMAGNIRVVFEKNINPFISNVNPTTSLVELNKTFLKQIMIAINKLFPNLRNMKKIQIGDEFSDKPYKIEDIHSVRQNNFEKQLEQKRMDFEVSINPSKPNEMDFSDKFQETKITSMDTLIAETMAKRNFDIEQIQYTNYNTTQPSDWLSPKETSLKTEKQQQYENVQKDMQKNNNKYLQPISSSFSSQPNQKGNNVSWEEEANISFEVEENITSPLRSTSEKDIFSKLKKMSPQEEKESVSKEISDMKEEMIRLNKNIEKIMEIFMNMNVNVNNPEIQENLKHHIQFS
jgi:hypothetical protein